MEILGKFHLPAVTSKKVIQSRAWYRIRLAFKFTHCQTSTMRTYSHKFTRFIQKKGQERKKKLQSIKALFLFALVVFLLVEKWFVVVLVVCSRLF